MQAALGQHTHALRVCMNLARPGRQFIKAITSIILRETTSSSSCRAPGLERSAAAGCMMHSRLLPSLSQQTHLLLRGAVPQLPRLSGKNSALNHSGTYTCFSTDACSKTASSVGYSPLARHSRGAATVAAPVRCAPVADSAPSVTAEAQVGVCTEGELKNYKRYVLLLKPQGCT